MKGSLPKTIYLARDMTYHAFMGCDTKSEAETYINGLSKKGYIETFQLEGDYYTFIDAKWIGGREKRETHGPVFGKDLNNQRVHKDHIRFILNYTK